VNLNTSLIVLSGLFKSTGGDDGDNGIDGVDAVNVSIVGVDIVGILDDETPKTRLVTLLICIDILIMYSFS
jgi:hypothetical protein